MSESPVAPSSPEAAHAPSAARSAEALAQRLARLTFDTNFAEERFFLILSVFIGIFSGLAVVCFRVAIDWSRIALMGPLPHPLAWRIIGAPTAVGLLVAILVIHFFPQVRGSGVNQTKAALYIFNGYIRSVMRSENSSARHSPSAPDSLSVPRTLRSRLEPRWP